MKIAPIHHNLVINFPCKVLGVGEELLSWFERAVLPNWAKKDIRKAADLIRVMKLRPTRIRGADGEIEQHFLGAWREYGEKSHDHGIAVPGGPNCHGNSCSSVAMD